jgi:hypothetical protein
VSTDAAYHESAYNPRLVVPQYADHFERWRKKSVAARTALSGYLDVPYGSHPMEKLDIFRAAVTGVRWIRAISPLSPGRSSTVA